MCQNVFMHSSVGKEKKKKKKKTRPQEIMSVLQSLFPQMAACLGSANEWLCVQLHLNSQVDLKRPKRPSLQYVCGFAIEKIFSEIGS